MDPNTDNLSRILAEIGTRGRFQTTFNVLFNFFLTVVGSMAMYNTVIALAVPKHWCKSSEFANESLRIDSASQCALYINGTQIDHCVYGYEYDQTYYTETMVTQEDWVCGAKLRVTQMLMFGKVGEIIGTIVFSQIGDLFGRKPVIYMSILTLLLGKLGLLISTGIYPLFVLFIIIGNLSALSLNQAPVVIHIEMSGVEDRTLGPLYQAIGFTIGQCLLAVIFWTTAHWIPMVLITTLPLIPFLFMQKCIIESPRWLASQGKMIKCVRELKRIAKTNRIELTEKNLFEFATDSEKNTTREEKNSSGILELFSSWKMVQLTILVILGWSCFTNTYVILVYNVTNLGGNPYLNYFWQGLAELPGSLLAKYLNDKLGRKFTRCAAFLVVTVFSSILAYLLNGTGYAIAISACGIILRCAASILFYTIYLHTVEIYPTCLRQTGASVGYMSASVFSIFIPFVIHLGTTMNPGYPYIFASSLCGIGAIFGLFLPETLNERLPENVKEAEEFGRHQRMWSMPRRKGHAPIPTTILTE